MTDAIPPGLPRLALPATAVPPAGGTAPAPPRPRPGVFDGALLTLGFAVVLFGTIIGLVILAFAWVVVTRGTDALKAPAGVEAGTLAALPPTIVEVLAWSFPIAYWVGLVYAVIVCRVVIGRGWGREVGLRRLPPAHLLLSVLALPGFVIISDLLAQLIFRLFGMAQQDQSAELGAVFGSFHWSFAVVAIGVGPGVVEELWCRGFLGRGFVSRYGWAWGVGLTSLVFGMLHFFPPPHIVVMAVMGLALHFTYAVSRSLWVPIAIHLLNNSFAGLVAVGAVPTAGVERATADHPAAVLALAAGLLVSAGVGMWAARGRVQVGPGAPVSPYGVMVPAGAAVVHSRPHPLPVAVAAACSGGLLWLAFG